MIESSKKHLESVQETYFEHQRVALSYSGKCFKAGVMALVHGLVPGWFQTGASDVVRSLADKNRANQNYGNE